MKDKSEENGSQIVTHDLKSVVGGLVPGGSKPQPQQPFHPPAGHSVSNHPLLQHIHHGVGNAVEHAKHPTSGAHGHSTPTPHGQSTPTPHGQSTPTPHGQSTPTPHGQTTPAHGHTLTPHGQTTPAAQGHTSAAGHPHQGHHSATPKGQHSAAHPSHGSGVGVAGVVAGGVNAIAHPGKALSSFKPPVKTPVWSAINKQLDTPLSHDARKALDKAAGQMRAQHQAMKGHITPDAKAELNRARLGLSNTATKKPWNPQKVVDQATENWSKADQRVAQAAKGGHKMSPQDIKELNRIIGEGLYNNGGSPGVLREVEIKANGRQYIPPEEVQAAMKGFSRWYKVASKTMNPVELASRSYQKLVSIHPFMDGNGRTTRLVMDHVLQSHGLPPSAMSDRNVALYSDGHGVMPHEAAQKVVGGLENSLKTLNGGVHPPHVDAAPFKPSLFGRASGATLHAVHGVTDAGQKVLSHVPAPVREVGGVVLGKGLAVVGAVGGVFEAVHSSKNLAHDLGGARGIEHGAQHAARGVAHGVDSAVHHPMGALGHIGHALVHPDEIVRGVSHAAVHKAAQVTSDAAGVAAGVTGTAAGVMMLTGVGAPVAAGLGAASLGLEGVKLGAGAVAHHTSAGGNEPPKK
jgi:prophage maintenance system killer protein